MRSLLYCGGDEPRLYRSTGEIREDIAAIAARIGEANLALNIRSLLLDILCEYADEKPEEWIPALEELTEDAKKTLAELRAFEETLGELRDELFEAQAIAAI